MQEKKSRQQAIGHVQADRKRQLFYLEQADRRHQLQADTGCQLFAVYKQTKDNGYFPRLPSQSIHLHFFQNLSHFPCAGCC